MITIDCSAEQAGRYEEELLIEITDRNMNEHPNGITYKLHSEVVTPSLSLTPDMFEEHTIIQNMSAFDPKAVRN